MEQPAILHVGEWSGTLVELAAALDVGATAPDSVTLCAAVAAARAAAADLDAASAAYALLSRSLEQRARALLPNPPPPAADEDPAGADEPEAETAALAERVAAYQAFAEAAAALREFEHRRRAQFGRPAPAAPPPRADAPDDGPTLERLLAAFAEVWERSLPRTGVVRRERITLAVAVTRLAERLRAAGSLRFGELFSAAADRLEVVVTFLALLELVRGGKVAVEQDEPFAPVRMAWRRGGGR